MEGKYKLFPNCCTGRKEIYASTIIHELQHMLRQFREKLENCDSHDINAFYKVSRVQGFSMIPNFIQYKNYFFCLPNKRHSRLIYVGKHGNFQTIVFSDAHKNGGTLASSTFTCDNHY